MTKKSTAKQYVNWAGALRRLAQLTRVQAKGLKGNKSDRGELERKPRAPRPPSRSGYHMQLHWSWEPAWVAFGPNLLGVLVKDLNFQRVEPSQQNSARCKEEVNWQDVRKEIVKILDDDKYKELLGTC